MIYFIFFWILIVISSLFYKKNKVKYERIIVPTFLLACSFLLVAIITRDPLFTTYGVPPEFEWIIGFFIAAFFSWKYYFNPLTKRVTKSENKITILETSVEYIKSDINIIRSDINYIKNDLSLVKEKLLKTN